MGFGGGGSAGMTAHVHNNVPLQGGPLDFANDTIASLNAGSTTFSDGAALQELVIGNPADTLVVNGAGTAPEWGAAGAGAWTVEGSASGTNVTALSVAVNTKDLYHVLYSTSDVSGGSFESAMTVNNDTGANYDCSVFWMNNSGATGGTASSNIDDGLLSVGGHTKSHMGSFYLFGNQPARTTGITYCGQETTSASTHGFDYATWSGGTNIGLTAAITSIECRNSSSVNVTGNMIVLSLDF